MYFVHETGDTSKVLRWGYVDNAGDLGTVPTGYTEVEGTPPGGFTKSRDPASTLYQLEQIDALLVAESTANQTLIYSCVVCYRSALLHGDSAVAEQIITDFDFDTQTTLQTNMLAVFPA